MRLKHIQRQFQKTVLEGKLSSLPIVEGGMTQEQRLSIYQRNTYESLREFLEHSYPKTQKVVGAEKFSDLARDFIYKFPPKKAYLDGFATPFASFLKGKVSDFVQAIASFENALRLILLQPMPAVLEAYHMEEVATKDPDHVFFVLHPSAQLYDAPYAFQNFWHVLGEKREDQPLERTSMLLHLEGFHGVFKPLHGSEELFLKSLQKGLSLGRAVDGVLEAYPEFNLAEKLSYYVTYGVLTLKN